MHFRQQATVDARILYAIVPSRKLILYTQVNPDSNMGKNNLLY